jgi:hypothetical protein
MLYVQSGHFFTQREIKHFILQFGELYISHFSTLALNQVLLDLLQK